MLEAKEVVKSFDGFRALDSATLTVPKGTVYGLVGPNGAGKSTIIRHFTGVYRPDSGKLLLEGAPIWENTDAKRRMVVIPDDWYYFPQASIAEMAKLYAGCALPPALRTSTWTAGSWLSRCTSASWAIWLFCAPTTPRWWQTCARSRAVCPS